METFCTCAERIIWLRKLVSNVYEEASKGCVAEAKVDTERMATKVQEEEEEEKATRGSWPYYWEQEATRNKGHRY